MSALDAFVAAHPRVLVLTGAGCSTASGIPDYRDESGEWKHRRPVAYADFVGSGAVRRRYWARSVVGWARVSQARPNAAHRALKALEDRGLVESLVTQNVDGLHQRAGSRRVIDLHGRLDVVSCLSCKAQIARADLQTLLIAWNPRLARVASAAAPDGDAPVEGPFDDVRVPDCPQCGGVLKPDVVFFGESVPKPRVESAMAALHRAAALLVVGSSLMAYSSYRFCVAAAAKGIPAAIVNRGRTRADHLVSLKIEADCGACLWELLDGLSAATSLARPHRPERRAES